MAYLANFYDEAKCEIAFIDLKSAQNFLLKDLIKKLKNYKYFTYRPSSSYSIKYIQSLDEYITKKTEKLIKNMEYENDASSNFEYNPNNINTIYHPKCDLIKPSVPLKLFVVSDALNNNPELKEEYKIAYEHIISLIPAQHKEVDKTIEQINTSIRLYYNNDRNAYKQDMDGPGPCTTKCSYKDLELPIPE
jgi:hypothetical protein